MPVSSMHVPWIRRLLLITSLPVVLVVVVGCTSVSPEPSASSSASPSPSASASPSAAVDPALVPVYPSEWTVDTAGAETTRIGAAIVASIDPQIIVNDDVYALPVPATADAAASFGVLHTITLTPTTDAAEQVEFIVEKLTGSGWSGRDASETGGVTLVALVSGAEPARAWFALVGADASVPGQSVVTVRVASPDLP